MKLVEAARILSADVRHGPLPVEARWRGRDNEFQELSKKRPQDVVSKGKVKLVNRILTPILELLSDEPTQQFLNMLDEDDLPDNSDVVLMLGQAIAAMKGFRTRHWNSNSYAWVLSD